MANLKTAKKYHFLYKTTNLLNDQFYIGIHSTNNLNDEYLGSGLRLKRSIKKYGRENFRLEILEYFNSRDLLVECEKNLVNENLLNDPLCMNLRPGGTGGFISTEYCRMGAIAANKILWNDVEFRKRNAERNKNRILTEESRIKLSISKQGINNPFYGKTHTDEFRKKISEINSKRQSGINNSNYGTCWITNGIDSKRIKKEDTVPDGWRYGRVMKKSLNF